LTGRKLCSSHVLTKEERTARARKAARASAEVRARGAEEKEGLQRAARLGAQALLGERLEAEAEEIVSRVVEIARKGDDNQALAAAKLLFERAYGRPMQPTQEVPVDMPVNWDELEAMSSEERRALMRAVSSGD
jgi:hypothetical protein